MKRTRKNFFPNILIAIASWLLFVLLVLLVSPNAFIALFAFFILLFAAILFTISLLTNRLIGLIISILITFILIFRFLGFTF